MHLYLNSGGDRSRQVGPGPNLRGAGTCLFVLPHKLSPDSKELDGVLIFKTLYPKSFFFLTSSYCSYKQLFLC